MRARNVIAWVLQVLLALLFLLSGGAKLVSSAPAQGLAIMGYPRWATFAIGVAELVFAIGLFIRRTMLASTAGLLAIMIGAIGSHILLTNPPEASAAPAVILAILLVALAALRRPWRGASRHGRAPAERPRL